jgi:hypothetical protein
MSDSVSIPRVPSREAIVRFFREHAPLPVKEAADLLGWPWPKLLSRAREEEAIVGDDLVAWAEVAFWLLQAWPRAWLLETLGEQATLIPHELHLTRVTWELPLYVVRAMERQAVLRRRERDDVHGTDVQEYVAELLHLAIDQKTVDALRDDPAFLRAYDYPQEPGGEHDPSESRKS